MIWESRIGGMQHQLPSCNYKSPFVDENCKLGIHALLVMTCNLEPTDVWHCTIRSVVQQHVSSYVSSVRDSIIVLCTFCGHVKRHFAVSARQNGPIATEHCCKIFDTIFRESCSHTQREAYQCSSDADGQ